MTMLRNTLLFLWSVSWPLLYCQEGKEDALKVSDAARVRTEAAQGLFVESILKRLPSWSDKAQLSSEDVLAYKHAAMAIQHTDPEVILQGILRKKDKMSLSDSLKYFVLFKFMFDIQGNNLLLQGDGRVAHGFGTQADAYGSSWPVIFDEEKVTISPFPGWEGRILPIDDYYVSLLGKFPMRQIP